MKIPERPVCIISISSNNKPSIYFSHEAVVKWPQIANINFNSSNWREHHSNASKAFEIEYVVTLEKWSESIELCISYLSYWKFDYSINAADEYEQQILVDLIRFNK